MRKSFLFSILLALNCWGQKDEINRIKSRLAETNRDAYKIDLLLKISEIYALDNIDSNLYYKKEALSISEKSNLKTTPFIVSETIKVISATNDFNAVIRFGNQYFHKFEEQKFIYDHLLIGSEMGYAYHALGKIDSASYYHEYVITHLNKKNKKERVLLVKTLRKRASSYLAVSKYNKAIIDLEDAIQLVDSSNYYDIYSIYITIANTYTQFGDYEKALHNFNNASAFVDKTDGFLPKMHILYSYASFYRRFGKYEKANEYALQGLSLAKANKHLYAEMILKSILAKTYIDLNQFNAAHPHLKDVIKYGQQFQTDEIVAVAEYDLGTVANQNKNYITAISYCKNAWKYLESTSLFMDKASTCNCLSDAYNGLGNYKKALDYYKKAVAFEDSINSEEQIKKTYQLQSKYDLEKKETIHKTEQQQQKLIATQKLKNKNQLVAGVSIVSVLGVAFGFLMFQIKQRKRETEVVIQREKEQEKFSQQLLQSQEEEKVRISRELHDSVGQDLILLKNQAQSSHNKELESNISSTLNNLRRITQGLHPFVLERFGLTSALKKLLKIIDQNSSVFISDEIDEIDNLLTTQQELHVYRIVQEAINNILKHSESPSALITAEKQEQYIAVSIKDYGKGFDWSKKSTLKNSLGMKTLQERAKILNAEFSIKSTKKKGTSIYLKIPITNAYNSSR